MVSYAWRIININTKFIPVLKYKSFPGPLAYLKNVLNKIAHIKLCSAYQFWYLFFSDQLSCVFVFQYSRFFS